LIILQNLDSFMEMKKGSVLKTNEEAGRLYLANITKWSLLHSVDNNNASFIFFVKSKEEKETIVQSLGYKAKSMSEFGLSTNKKIIITSL